MITANSFLKYNEKVQNSKVRIVINIQEKYFFNFNIYENELDSRIFKKLYLKQLCLRSFNFLKASFIV